MPKVAKDDFWESILFKSFSRLRLVAIRIMEENCESPRVSNYRLLRT
jgi:hypothetical protein